MHIHFIAIGGSAMHNLALALAQKGEKVTGSDDAIFEPSRSRLEKEGLLPDELGWHPERITKSIDAVILGMHAKSDNPELLKAKELGLKIYSYPEFLFEQGKEKTRVVIGGSHGKTTITSMILHVLQKLDKKVDYMVGAQLEGYETMVHLTRKNKYMVLEGDEYLSSALDPRPKFHLYQPQIALLSGIAWDHINVFPTFKKYVEQFKIFISQIPDGGILLFNTEDETLKKLVETTPKSIQRIGYVTPTYRIVDGATYLQTQQGEVEIQVFGNHNLNNLAGAKVVCEQMGVNEAAFYEAIKSFKGASKRLEKIAEKETTVVYKDFAHSPSKVVATTEAVKKQYPNKRLIACFELHTYSSLNAKFLEEYQNSLQAADEAVVFYSPEAVKIKGLKNIKKEQIEAAFDYPDLRVYTEAESFQHYLKQKDWKDSVLLLMSSGNYGGLDFSTISSWI